MISDEELVRRTLSEGSRHFGELIRRHADYLFGLGMRLTSGNIELSEDISQQTFMKAYRSLKRFDPGRNFKQWLTGIAVNCFKDFALQEKRYSPIDEKHEQFYTADLDADRDFYKLINPLTEEEKLLFTLRFVYDYTVDEIGGILDMKSGTIKSRLSRALEKLR